MSSFSPYELHFDNVRLPGGELIGAEGGGFKLASNFLSRTDRLCGRTDRYRAVALDAASAGSGARGFRPNSPTCKAFLDARGRELNCGRPDC